MTDVLLANESWLACACVGLCVFFATLVVVDFISYTSGRYKERYVEEAAVELDDVLLQMPPSRIFDLSLALSALAAFLFLGVLCLAGIEWSWVKALFAGGIPACLAFPVPRLVLRHLRKARLAKFNEQLEDALLSMSSSLKAGFSITQAIDGVASENRKPISFEFRLLMQEIRLGVQLDDALRKMVARLDNNVDFDLVATAIITARQTGGELTQVLERLAGVIRERMRIMNRVSALTAQGKMQASVIGAMPFLLMLAMAYISPDMMSAFFNSMMGVLLIIGAVILVTIGFFVIKKITTIDI
jgi:tight adherence protein B